MRNLKRVLSLTLASVMLLGMMVVGASAAEGYTDVDDDIHNIEAIDVLQVVNVMNGYAEDGDFHPDDNVTRAQMARIMAELLDLDYDYYEAVTSPFSDVGGIYSWAKKYIDACAANGIVVGRGGTIYDPGANVTAVEASSMLMRALGYFRYSNDYSDGFELSTVSQGTKIGIYDNVNANASEPMTRNQVAQMVLNTLKSGMVQPDGNTINLTTPDGSILTGKVNYVYVTSSKDFATAISDVTATNMGSSNSGYIVEMGEQLYNGKLKLYDGRLDDFGRPSRHWEYDGKSIGTYMKKELLKETYTTKVTGKTLYELLGSETVKDYDFTITIDGETEKAVLDHNDITFSSEKAHYFFDQSALNRSNTNQVGGTDKGVLTQVFVNGVKKEIHIAIINTYLAKASADYNEKRDEATFTIYNLSRVDVSGVKSLVKNKTDKAGEEAVVNNEIVSGEDFDIKDIKADDICLVHVSGNEIKEMFAPQVIDEASITAFKTNSYVVADGSQYDYAHTAMYDFDVLDNYVADNMKDTTYRIYLDLYDYLIGIEILESEKHYAFLTGINGYSENLRDQTAIGNLVFLDGTSQNVSINMKKSLNAQGDPFTTPVAAAKYDVYGIRTDTRVSSLMNTWVTYSVDDSGIYTIKEVPNTKATFENKNSNTAGHGQRHEGGTYLDPNNDDAVTYYYNGSDDPTVLGTPGNRLGYNTANPLGYAVEDGADDEYVELNKGHVVLAGIPNTDWTRVYSNNDTVFLTAELDVIRAKNVLSQGGEATLPAVIITGADSVSVGVQDVDMKAYNAQAVLSHNTKFAANPIEYMNVSDGVYTLFDKYGDVIAVMVVGADDGANVSYAWVSSSSMSREALVDGDWEYSRDVIIDGKLVTLTEIETGGTDDPTIHSKFDPASRTSFWWEVKTKADGTVKEVTRIKWAPGVETADWASGDKDRNYVYDIDMDSRKGTTIVNQSFNMGTGGDDQRNPDYIPWDTVTDIDDDANVKYNVRASGSTLHVEGRTGNRRGFAVAPSATIVVVKDEAIKRGDDVVDHNWKADIKYFTNDKQGNGLKQAVTSLNDSTNFKGYIAAVNKDGRAETLIIYDKSGDDVIIGGGVDIDNDPNVFAVEDPASTITVYYVGKDTVAENNIRLTNAKIESAIFEHLTKDQGWTVEEVVVNGADARATIIYHDDSGRTRTVVWEIQTIPLDKETYEDYQAEWAKVNWKK